MTWQELMRQMSHRLKAGHISDPDREALYLLEWATGRRYAEWVVSGGGVEADSLAKAEAGLARRLSHEPLAYITGHREFFGLDLAVSPAVLIPRPETEILVETVLKRVTRGAARVADVGTGSGAIALALKSARPDWTLFGCDIDEAALDVARENGRRLNLTVCWLLSDLLASVPPPVDAVVANLPYVDPEGDLSVSWETTYEPPLALYEGDGGMKAIRRLLQQAPDWLAPSGQIFLECAPDQAQKLTGDLHAAGFGRISVVQDYAGLDRVLSGTKI